MFRKFLSNFYGRMKASAPTFCGIVLRTVGTAPVAVRLFYTNSDFARVAEVRVSGGDLCIRKYAEAQPSRQVRTSTPTRLVYHYRFALNSILIGRAMHAPTGLYRLVILSVSEESHTEQSNLILGRARACSRRKVLSDFGGSSRTPPPTRLCIAVYFVQNPILLGRSRSPAPTGCVLRLLHSNILLQLLTVPNDKRQSAP